MLVKDLHTKSIVHIFDCNCTYYIGSHSSIPDNLLKKKILRVDSLTGNVLGIFVFLDE